jgi:hypothetical protein
MANGKEGAVVFEEEEGVVVEEEEEEEEDEDGSVSAENGWDMEQELWKGRAGVDKRRLFVELGAGYREQCGNKRMNKGCGGGEGGGGGEEGKAAPGWKNTAQKVYWESVLILEFGTASFFRFRLSNGMPKIIYHPSM